MFEKEDKNKIKTISTIIYIAVVSLLAIFVVDLTNNTNVVVFSILVPLLYVIIENIMNIILYKYPIRIKLIMFLSKLHHNERVRVSISNLAIIKVKNRYLLIEKTKNGNSKYIPIGGVAHYTNDDFKNLFYIEEDDFQGRDLKDLRFFMKQKKLSKLLKYLEQMKFHESGVMREVAEEIGFTPEILNILINSEQSYHHTSISYEKTEHPDEVGNVKHLLFYYRIFELHINVIHEQTIEDYVRNHTKLYLATRDQIENFRENNIQEYTNVILDRRRID